jgi:signal transduction histidine kinase
LSKTQRSVLDVVRPAPFAEPANGAGAQQAGEASGRWGKLYPLPTEAPPRPQAAAAKPSAEWIARELHDGVAQNLTFLDLELATLLLEADDTSEALRTRLASMQGVVRETLEQVRALMGSLRQPAVTVDTLQSRLLRVVEGFRMKSQVHVALSFRDCGEQVRLPSSVLHEIESIVHEALCNAWRHGQSRKTKVVVQQETEGITVKVADGGCGFDPASRPAGHYGLSIMEERAAGIGGSLEIASTPGRGTTVRLFVPWSQVRVA